MTANANSAQPRQDVAARKNFFLGRQPILDRNQALLGYELMFCNAANGPAETGAGLSATAAVIAHTAQLGLDKVLGGALGFLDVDADVIMSDIFAFLPRELIVLQISAGMPTDAALLERMAELANHGFRFALNDVTRETPEFERLLPLIDFVKVDVREMGFGSMLALTLRCKRENKKLLAGRVETPDEFKSCLELGFDYFQGYHFATPAVFSGRKLSPSQQTVMELMNLIMSDVDNIDIERAVKRDAALALNLLRLVNTPAIGARQRIDSVSQALIVLGRRQLQRWLQIMLYVGASKNGPGTAPLLLLATTRGRLLELLAQRLRPKQRSIAEVAFTVGIMSLMDALFGIPMGEIVQQFPVSEEIVAALNERSGFFGELLRLAESLERIDQEEGEALPNLRELAISSDELVELEMAAFEWSDTVVKYAI
jgi:EAL and modified HD-GYP domain-containing signal transduction protein